MLKGRAEASQKKTELGREKVIGETDRARGRQAERSPGGQGGLLLQGRVPVKEFTGEEGHQGLGGGGGELLLLETKLKTVPGSYLGKRRCSFPKSHQD